MHVPGSRAEKKWAKFKGKSCKCTTMAEQESIFKTSLCCAGEIWRVGVVHVVFAEFSGDD